MNCPPAQSGPVRRFLFWERAQQPRRQNVEAGGQFHDGGEFDVGLGQFDAADEIAVQVTQLRQLLLRETAGHSQRPDFLAEHIKVLPRINADETRIADFSL